MAKQTFTIGQVLTAAQMTSLQQTAMGGGSTTAKTASYTLVAADAGTVVQMNSASATTITVNTALFSAGDTVQIQNVGAGVCTVTAGSATVSTAGSLALSQYEGGSLYFNTTSAALFFDIVQTSGMTNPLTTTGDTIYSSSGTTPARLGIGSAGQVLTVASGIPSWATPAASASGLTLISANTFSAMTTLSVNNCFSATYKNYRIVTEFIGSTGNNLYLRMRNGGTDDTTSNYRWAMNYISAASGTIGNQDFGNTLTYGAIGYNVGASAQYQGTSCDVFNPFAAQITSIAGNGTGSTNGMLFFNTHYVASSFDGFTVYPSGGNVTGSIRIYGYQNS